MARTKKTAAPDAARSAAHAAPAPGPVPSTDPTPDGPAAAVQAALAARPDGATTADIARAAGISRAAAGKALAAMQTAGTAARTRGSRPGIPDTWHPAAPAATASPAAGTDSASPADAAGPAGDPGRAGQEAAGPPSADDTGPGQDERPDNEHPADGAAGTREGAGEPGQDDPDGTAAPGAGQGEHADGDSGTEVAPDPAVTAAIGGHAGKIGFAAAAVTTALQAGDLGAALAAIQDIWEQAGQARRTLKAAAGGRKAPAVKPGALRELVAAHLRQFPGENFTPHQIGKKLARSSGAVANALDKLVALGEAELATEKPRSFRLAAPAATPPSQHTTAPDSDQAEDGDAEEPVAGAA